jgi:hypothetical protein
MRVAAVGQFDFDHFAAEIAEETPRIRPGDVPADIDHNCPVERSSDRVFRHDSM